MITKEDSTKIINFMTHVAGVLLLGCVFQNYKFHMSHYSEYVLSSILSIYFTLIVDVLKDYDAAFLYHC